MIASFTDDLRAALVTRGVPYAVVYGPERLRQTVLAEPHIVVMRDRQQGETFRGPKTTKQNPPLDHVRTMAVRCVVYGKSYLAGASVADHERVADKVVDQIVIAMRAIVNERQTEWVLTGGRLLSDTDLAEDGLEAWPGVAYELRFTVDRGVRDETYAGEYPDESTIGGTHGIDFGTSLSADGTGQENTLPSAETEL
jgi:hypothetical protein